MKKQSPDKVSVVKICQANTHVFRDLYIYNTLFVFVMSGSKNIDPGLSEKFSANANELLIFPSGSFISIENRVISREAYQALCISYPDHLVDKVFDESTRNPENRDAILVQDCPNGLIASMKSLLGESKSTLYPYSILEHRALEPLLWIKSLGIHLTTPYEKKVDQIIRELVKNNLCHKWRIDDIAIKLGYSQATLKRRLSGLNTTFSEIVTNVRLENALTLLQTSDLPISLVALQSGFSTPSHFSDAFRKRFDIQPKHIRNSID